MGICRNIRGLLVGPLVRLLVGIVELLVGIVGLLVGNVGLLVSIGRTICGNISGSIEDCYGY